jgi:hypothetical protein
MGVDFRDFENEIQYQHELAPSTLSDPTGPSNRLRISQPPSPCRRGDRLGRTVLTETRDEPAPPSCRAVLADRACLRRRCGRPGASEQGGDPLCHGLHLAERLSRNGPSGLPNGNAMPSRNKLR